MKLKLPRSRAVAARPRERKAPTLTGAPGGAALTKIMVPVDFSTPSLKTLDYAIALATKASASVHLFHVVEPSPLLITLRDMPIILSDTEVAKHWSHMLAQTAQRQTRPNVPITAAVRIGNPIHEFVKVAQEMEADLLVVATHGRTGLAHVLLGSMAEHIVRHAPCPVLVVREHERDFAKREDGGAPVLTLRKILVPVDMSPFSRSTLRYAADFAARYGGRIMLLHCLDLLDQLPPSIYSPDDAAAVIREATEKAQQELEELARAEIPAGVEAEVQVIVGSPLAQTPELAENGEFDLVICGAHGHSGVKLTLLGSIAEGIVRHAPCPVLVVRAPLAAAERKEPPREAV